MGFLKSSILRKVAMALSGLFLVVFLLQHFTINFSSVLSPDTFNNWSHFMGYNPFIQFILQPILILGIIFHFVMGFVLEFQNRRSRSVGYAKFKGIQNATWVSQNMIYSGLVVLFFLAYHMLDFWVPEMNHKFVHGSLFNVELVDTERYYQELLHKFESPVRVVLYVLSFVFLALHLYHGFASSFQSMGVLYRYKKVVNFLTRGFAVLIPVGFAFIALYHHFFSIHRFSV